MLDFDVRFVTRISLYSQGSQRGLGIFFCKDNLLTIQDPTAVLDYPTAQSLSVAVFAKDFKQKMIFFDVHLPGSKRHEWAQWVQWHPAPAPANRARPIRVGLDTGLPRRLAAARPATRRDGTGRDGRRELRGRLPGAACAAKPRTHVVGPGFAGDECIVAGWSPGVQVSAQECGGSTASGLPCLSESILIY